MKLLVLGSSSAGNCYLLRGNSQTLILEAGLPLKAVKQALNFCLQSVAGCLISHRHGDHALHLTQYVQAGIPTWANTDTIEKLPEQYQSMVAGTLRHGKQFNIGEFKILPFEVKHDVPCFGFIIQHNESGKILFITDTHEVPYKFKGLNHIMIEANYEEEILVKNVWNGKVDPQRAERVRRSHLSVENCVHTLACNDLSEVANIILLHLSPHNSDADSFRSRVVEATGIPTAIATPGLEVELNKNIY